MGGRGGGRKAADGLERKETWDDDTENDYDERIEPQPKAPRKKGKNQTSYRGPPDFLLNPARDDPFANPARVVQDEDGTNRPVDNMNTQRDTRPEYAYTEENRQAPSHTSYSNGNLLQFDTQVRPDGSLSFTWTVNWQARGQSSNNPRLGVILRTQLSQMNLDAHLARSPSHENSQSGSQWASLVDTFKSSSLEPISPLEFSQPAESSSVFRCEWRDPKTNKPCSNRTYKSKATLTTHTRESHSKEQESDILSSHKREREGSSAMEGRRQFTEHIAPSAARYSSVRDGAIDEEIDRELAELYRGEQVEQVRFAQPREESNTPGAARFSNVRDENFDNDMPLENQDFDRREQKQLEFIARARVERKDRDNEEMHRGLKNSGKRQRGWNGEREPKRQQTMRKHHEAKDKKTKSKSKPTPPLDNSPISWQIIMNLFREP